MKPLFATSLSLVSALGRGTAPAFEALRAGRGGLRRNDFLDSTLDTWIGRVEGIEADAAGDQSGKFSDYRMQRIAQAGLVADDFSEAVAHARDRHGAKRIGVFLGTSSAGMLQGELAYRTRRPGPGALPEGLVFRDSFNMYAPAAFVRAQLGLQGPAAVVSTACSSGAKVFASAARAIEAGLCDAAVVGGVETLCFTTLHGFTSLELLSREPCRPCDPERGGISLGEGAAYVLLEKKDAAGNGLALLGYGESADAHHMSTPHPEGLGAALAMRAALGRAGLAPADIGYINLHGTGTRNNDAAEDAGVFSVVGSAVPCSATKGYTGHTLGAAGAIEAVLTLLCLREGYLPGTLNARSVDPVIRSQILLEGRSASLEHALSNSFGFGGNNCSLVFGRSN
ncbi:MAG TPA: beta-ketoacyl-[acyl-carrier-protein] synthase family protein [Burkholderiales bacterium]|nr:beta-ketoacyl-[acyl-carrier-protein] synthase family protein [Burkholderiales bacterium]